MCRLCGTSSGNRTSHMRRGFAQVTRSVFSKQSPSCEETKGGKSKPRSTYSFRKSLLLANSLSTPRPSIEPSLCLCRKKFMAFTYLSVLLYSPQVRKYWYLLLICTVIDEELSFYSLSNNLSPDQGSKTSLSLKNASSLAPTMPEPTQAFNLQGLLVRQRKKWR